MFYQNKKQETTEIVVTSTPLLMATGRTSELYAQNVLWRLRFGGKFTIVVVTFLPPSMAYIYGATLRSTAGALPTTRRQITPLCIKECRNGVARGRNLFITNLGAISIMMSGQHDLIRLYLEVPGAPDARWH
ncbi:hypothetical protein AAG570_011429 [Ranatra chinensis]|uniref:Uncharacterized protein n=1 Tax=Ranatra chinensis TaxID=642074 RepID=A0ABD0YWU1_9HEMI